MSLDRITTGRLAVFLLCSKITVFATAVVHVFEKHDFLYLFRWRLQAMRPTAVVELLLPAMPARIKKWCYAGVGLFSLTATGAHTARIELRVDLRAQLAVLRLARRFWFYH